MNTTINEAIKNIKTWLCRHNLHRWMSWRLKEDDLGWFETRHCHWCGAREVGTGGWIDPEMVRKYGRK